MDLILEKEIINQKRRIKELQEEKENSIMCVACKENKKNMLYTPCKHICCCEECDKSITRCPMCRTQIKERIKIYL